MNHFRYNVALSVLFDNENNNNEVEGFPVSIMESPEGKKRLAMYSWIRREIRELMIQSPDIPIEVEQRLRQQIRSRRYKISQWKNEKLSFALLMFGRKKQRLMRKKMW